jgi:hypothetical protein
MSTSTLSPRKRRANRRNALKSTGPRTVEGKNRSARNATTHGLFCQHLILPGENKRLFHLLREGMIFTLSPQTYVELLLVDRIVSATWKLRRLQEAEATVLHFKLHELADAPKRQLEDALPQLANYSSIEAKEIPVALALSAESTDENGLQRLSQYEQRLEGAIHRNLRELERLRKFRRTQRKNKENQRLSPYLGNFSFMNMENEPTESKNDANSKTGQTLNDPAPAETFRRDESVT